MYQLNRSRSCTVLSSVKSQNASVFVLHAEGDIFPSHPTLTPYSCIINDGPPPPTPKTWFRILPRTLAGSL